MRRLIVFASLFLLSFYEGKQLDFVQNDIPAAQDRAAQQGKLVVVAFGAKWCQPCLFMDENTWGNADVIDFAEQHYVPVKVDVDNFDGLIYRDKYNVRFYPTILVFNSKGELLKKREGMLGPEAMLGFLQSFVSKENASRVNAAPPPSSLPNSSATNDFAAASATPETPAENVQPPVIYQDNSSNDFNKTSNKNKQNAIVNQPRERTAAKPVFAPPPTNNLRQNLPQKGFTVQVGLFVVKTSASAEAERVGKKYGKKVWLVESSWNGKRVYRGLVGEFPQRELADSFKLKLRSAGQDACLKNWTDLH